MAVNRELPELERLLADVPGCLRPGGRLVIIAFHSLEDRMVKHRLRELSVQLRNDRGGPIGTPAWRVLTKKPITPERRGGGRQSARAVGQAAGGREGDGVKRGPGGSGGRRPPGTAMFCVILVGLTLGALGHVAVQAQKNEVAVQLGREQAVYETLVTQRRHQTIEIGRLKNPGGLVDLARDRLGMTPQPAGIRVVPAPGPEPVVPARRPPRPTAPRRAR